MAKKSLSEIKKIVRDYVKELKKKDISPQMIILYGSYASNTATDASDIDIVVISNDLSKWPPIERLQILSIATMNIDAPLEVLGYTPEEIKAHGHESIIWAEIQKNGKEIYKEAA
ncbi:MAG: nucleotidyltransferase domain-containing protein [Pseudomonadota bacterium]